MAIEKTSSGKYRAVVYHHGVRRIGTTRQTKREARLDYSMLLDGIKRPTSNVTVGRLVRDAMTRGTSARTGLPWAMKTRESYERAHGEMPPRLLKTPVGELTPMALRDFLAEIPNGHYRDKAHQLLGVVLKGAVVEGLITFNPTTVVPSSPPKPKEIQIPSVDEVEAIIAAAPAQWATFIRLAARCGARRGEMCALQWADFDGQTLYIRRAIAQGDNDTEVTEGKTGRKGWRKVPISPAMITELSELDRSSAWMFPDGEGGYRKPHAASRMFRRAAMKAGTKDYSFHSLRHFFASRMLLAGRPLIEVGGFMGHTTTQMQQLRTPERPT